MKNSTVAINNQAYLCSEQYHDASNLDARNSMRDRYSTNPYSWSAWVFDQFEIPTNAKILELGCGPGDLWLQNLTRTPADWEITLSDFSPGMLSSLQERLGKEANRFTFQEIDAQSIPFDDDTFHAVIANHMFYHVPDRAKAFDEIRRVLRSDGILYAATDGENNMHELNELCRKFDPVLYETEWKPLSALPFTLQNGRSQLEAFFSDVSLLQREDGFAVPEVEPLLAYTQSGSRQMFMRGREAEFAQFMAHEMEAVSIMQITKQIGLFVAKL